MKQATLQIKYNEEKLNAIRQYMDKKDAKLQNELEEVIQKLYEKYVPMPVREYIDSRPQEPELTTRRPSKPSARPDNRNISE